MNHFEEACAKMEEKKIKYKNILGLLAENNILDKIVRTSGSFNQIELQTAEVFLYDDYLVVAMRHVETTKGGLRTKVLKRVCAYNKQEEIEAIKLLADHLRQTT